MYSLTLTTDEREAINWIGTRYATGHEFHKLLSACLENDQEWNEPGDITFSIPEHTAWAIVDLFEEEELLFPCFSLAFKEKLLSFMEKIV